MADKKISQLTGATTPLAGTEVLPIVQSGSTVKVASDDLTVKNVRSNATTGILQVAGPSAAATRVMTTPDANFTVARTDAANSFTGNQTLSNGNLIIGTSGKGIDFSATGDGTGTATSELLDDYEEGTWVPAVSGLTLTAALGTYTKIGNKVFANFQIASNALTDATSFLISGVPYIPNVNATEADRSAGYLTYNPGTTNWTLLFGSGSSSVAFREAPGGTTGTITDLSGQTLWGTLVYTSV